MRLFRRWPRPLHLLPAHVLNGVTAALGIGLVQVAVGTFGGHAAALVASGGAVFASLADVPNAPHRTLRRVATAAAIGAGVTFAVCALQAHVLWLGLLTMVVGLLSALALAWGLRAGPISFVGILAIVFTMASTPRPGWASWLEHAGWTALGGALYLAWALLTSTLLQPRFRTLALAAALAGAAQLLRSRAEILMRYPGQQGDVLPPLKAWIGGEAALSDRLQAARDLLFAAPDSLLARRQTLLLLSVIDLRDTLVASELDLDVLGHDGADGHARAGLAAHLIEMAVALEQIDECLRMHQPLPASRQIGHALETLAGAALYEAHHERAPLLSVLLDRARHMVDCVGRMRRLLPGPEQAATAEVPLTREQLALFVSVEGWPLAALRLHLSWQSSVLRHAVRTGLALGLAYFIALALPWSSHPAWLVLSVAVVLRGNLEQTLTRRNARVAGTVLGCLTVLGFEQLGTAWLSSAVFLVAVGVAHAFLNVRYLITAAAASVMALLQAHLVHPEGELAVDERLADTVLGALLAWAFSYVLPSWEQRNVQRLAPRLARSLAVLTRHTLRWPEGAAADLPLRLARREVYDALDGLAAAAQRTSVEPESVRVPPYAFATLLRHSHRLLADLAAVKLLLERRRHEMDADATRALLQAAAAQLQARLAPDAAGAGVGASGPDPSGAAPEPAGPVVASPHSAMAALPVETAGEALLPWLQRRLRIAATDANNVAHSASALQALARQGGGTPP